jgi:putative transposase
MATKFNNKYRIEPARLKNWDYSRNAPYYITICTSNRECYFGEIKEETLILSEIGKIVYSEWLKTPEIRPDMNIELGEFIVMPNHFHGILIIGKNQFNDDVPNGRDAMHRDSDGRDAMHGVSTNDMGNKYQNQFGPQSKNLSSIIRGFKSAVTVQARQIHADFGWQSRFYDHIIRNGKSYDNISQYIIDNPRKWIDDEFNK